MHLQRIFWKITSVSRRMKPLAHNVRRPPGKIRHLQASPLNRARQFAIWLALVLLSACQPALTPVARPTPQILTIESTPALQVFSAQFKTCTDQLGNTGLVLLDTPANAIDLSRAPVALRWGAGADPEGFAAVIGQEDLVVVVNPKNPLQAVSLADLKGIYSGAQHEWQGTTSPTEIQAWAYPSGDDVQVVFETSVLGGPPAPRVTSTAPNPAAMREAVAASPNAIGYLPRRWVDGSVKALTVNDLPPAQLRQPILALSKAEPTGLLKNWLLCLQDRLKEGVK